MTADHAPLSAEVGRLREVDREGLWYALATTPCGPLHAKDGWTPGEPCHKCADVADSTLAYLSARVQRILDDHLASLLVTVEQQAEALGRVEALADEWEARAVGSAQSAAAREGLSDAHQLTDYSEMMHRRSFDIRAALKGDGS